MNPLYYVKVTENILALILTCFIITSWIIRDQQETIQTFVHECLSQFLETVPNSTVSIGLNEFVRDNQDRMPLVLLVVMVGIYMVYQKLMLKKQRVLPETSDEIVDTHDVSDLYFDCDESMQLSLPEPDELETDYETEPEEVAGGSPGKVIFHIESSESDCESDFIADSYRVYHVNLTRAKAVAIKCVIMDVRDKLSGLTRPFPVRVVIVDEDMRVDVDEYIEPGRRLEFVDAHKGFRIDGLPYKLVRREILNILRGSLIVGFDLRQEFKAFEFTDEISEASVRDAGVAKMFMMRKQPPATGWEHPSLPDLIEKHLHLEMRDCLDAVECATAAMALYKKYRHLAPAGWYRRQRKSQHPPKSDLES